MCKLSSVVSRIFDVVIIALNVMDQRRTWKVKDMTKLVRTPLTVSKLLLSQGLIQALLRKT